MATFEVVAAHAFDRLEDQPAAQALTASLREQVTEGCVLDAVPQPEETDTPKCTASSTEMGAMALYCPMWCGLWPKRAHYWIDVEAIDEGSIGSPIVYAAISCTGVQGWIPAPPFGVSCSDYDSCQSDYPEGIKYGSGACMFLVKANDPKITKAECGTKGPPW